MDLSYLTSVKKKADGILTETSKKVSISNEQYPGLERDKLFEANVIALQKTYPDLIIRNIPTDCYNCHGMTFASRRTGIYEPEEIKKILEHDNYKLINNIEDVLPGDVIIYYAPDGDIEHSGLIIEKANELKVPKVLSKWGMLYEVIHYAFLCPYNTENIHYYRCQL
jgi:hypothetical protein